MLSADSVTRFPVLGMSTTAPTKTKHRSSKEQLGIFQGVIVPTCDVMWSVVIFLRFPAIVGHAGLGLAILIVTLSFAVALLTSLALSAIATCGTSHSLTGVYPILARALGKEIATATGLVYFLGVVCLVVLELLGSCEVVFEMAPALAAHGGEHSSRLWALLFLSALSLFVGGCVRAVSKLGLAFFAVVTTTLLLLYLSPRLC